MRYLVIFTGLLLYFQITFSQDYISGSIIDSGSGELLSLRLKTALQL
jgi:hypothetical protein